MSHQENVKLGTWEVTMYVDDDNHLTVWVKNSDNSAVHALDADIALDLDNEWGERFTTANIENLYNKGEKS